MDETSTSLSDWKKPLTSSDMGGRRVEGLCGPWGVIMRFVMVLIALALSACGASVDEQFVQTMKESIAAADDEETKQGFRSMLKHKGKLSNDQKKVFIESWGESKSRKAALTSEVIAARDSGETSEEDANAMLADIAKVASD